MIITLGDLINKYPTNINTNKMHKNLKNHVIGVKKDIFKDISQYNIEHDEYETCYKKKGSKKESYDFIDKHNGTVLYGAYNKFIINFDKIQKPTHKLESGYETYTYFYEYHILEVKWIPDNYRSLSIHKIVNWVDAKPYPIQYEKWYDYKGEIPDIRLYVG